MPEHEDYSSHHCRLQRPQKKNYGNVAGSEGVQAGNIEYQAHTAISSHRVELGNQNEQRILQFKTLSTQLPASWLIIYHSCLSLFSVL